MLRKLDKPGNPIRDLWNRLHRLPAGKRIFSRLVGMAAPYTGTMGAQVVALARGRSEVTLEDRGGVRNHLNCIHAIAQANLAELTGNIAVAYTLPDDGRFIVAGMEIEYVKKARGKITGTCEVPPIASSERAEYAVPVIMTDAGGEVVAR